MVKILTTVLSDGLPAVEAACAEELNENVHSADVILNILPRRRDAAKPITIMTPDALNSQTDACCIIGKPPSIINQTSQSLP